MLGPFALLAWLFLFASAHAAELPELYALEALPGNRVLAVKASDDQLLVLSQRGTVLSRKGGSGSAEGFRTPREADARLGIATLLADRDNGRICRLDAHLELQGELLWPGELSPDFIAADLLALSDTRLLVLADRRRGGMLVLDNLDTWRPLWDSRHPDFAGRIQALECLGESALFVRASGADASLCLCRCDGSLRQRLPWPHLQSLHRSLSQNALLLAVLDEDSLRVHRLERQILLDGLPATPADIPPFLSLAAPEGELRDFLLLPEGLLLAVRGGAASFVPLENCHTRREQVRP